MNAYLSLIKFRYHLTFLNVVFGTLIFARDPTPWLVPRLVALYLSFNVLLYGGIYTMNDLADRDADAAHPLKRLRPIAARRVGVRTAARFSVILILSGLVSGLLLFGVPIFACYLVILAINIAYSAGARNTPYLDLAFNSLPHTVRFLMGALLVGRRPPAGHLLAFLFLAIAMSCLRRQIERDMPGWEARRTLNFYTTRELSTLTVVCLAAVLVLAARDRLASAGFFSILLAGAAVLVGGGHFSTFVRNRLKAVWTR